MILTGGWQARRNFARVQYNWGKTLHLAPLFAVIISLYNEKM